MDFTNEDIELRLKLLETLIKSEVAKVFEKSKRILVREEIL